MEKYTQKMIENAHKVVFLVKNYPDKNLEHIIAALQMPAIEINNAIWVAVDMGFIVDPDTTEGKMELLKEPEEYQLGQACADLRAMIVFTFNRLATQEKDLEENYMSNWTLGYAGHDVLITLKQLINEHVLATYQLTDPEDTKSTYTFYSLYENSEQMWGRKNFKQQPTGEEVPDTSAPEDDTPEEDKHLNSGDATESEK